MKIVLEVDGEAFEIQVRREGETVHAECEGERFEGRVTNHSPTVVLQRDRERHVVEVVGTDEARINDAKVRFRVARFEPEPAAGPLGHVTKVNAVMHGRLVKVLVRSGQVVEKGEPLFILEAMKMQNRLLSPAAGRVSKLVAQEGDVVEAGRPLAELEPVAE